MIPVHCRVKHDPERGEYGDCFRACIASLLEIECPENVPLFIKDGEIDIHHLTNWLDGKGYAPFFVTYDAVNTRQEVMRIMDVMNSNALYLLFGSTSENDHVVICKGDAVLHDPAWIKRDLLFPNKGSGCWVVMVIAIK